MRPSVIIVRLLVILVAVYFPVAVTLDLVGFPHGVVQDVLRIVIVAILSFPLIYRYVFVSATRMAAEHSRNQEQLAAAFRKLLSLFGAGPEERFAERAVEALRLLVKARHAVISVCNETDEDTRIVSSVLTNEERDQLESRLNREQVHASACRDARPVRIEPAGSSRLSVFCAPIVAGDKVYGSVCAAAKLDGERFTEDDVVSIESLARQMGLRIAGDLERVERGRAEQAMRETQERIVKDRMLFDAILRTTPNGLCLVESNWKIFWCNVAVSHLLDPSGAGTQDLCGMHLGQLFADPAQFDDYTRAAPQSVRANGIDVREIELGRLDGSRFWCELSLVRHDPASTAPGYVATLVDVSARKRVEHEREVLSHLGLALAGADELEMVAESVESAAQDLWKFDAAFLCVRHSGSARFRPILAVDVTGGRRTLLELGTLAADQVGDGHSVSAGKAFLVNRAADESRGGPLVGGGANWSSGSAILAPVRTGDHVSGFILLQSRTEGCYAQTDRDLLQRIADATAPALERCRAEFYGSTFSSLGQRLSATVSPEEAAGVLAEAADRLIGWDSCWIDLCSEAEDRAYNLFAADVIDARRQKVEIDRGNESAGVMMTRCIPDGARLVQRDVSVVAASKLVPFGDTSRLSLCLMFVPIRIAEKTIGVLSIQSYSKRAYGYSDLNDLQALADLCGGAFERALVLRQLKRSEARFRLLFDQAPIAISISREGVILFANHAYVALFHFRRADEVVGTNLLDSVDPKHRQEFGALIARGEAGERRTAVREITGVRRDGTTFPYRVEAFVIDLPDGVATVAFVTDLTAIRRAESERETLAALGVRLAGADTVEKVADIVQHVLEKLVGWDAFSLVVRRSGTARFRPVARCDTVDGARIPFPIEPGELIEYAHRESLLRGESLLINRDGSNAGSELQRFGDTSRVSASLVFAPVRVEGRVTGVLSTQSYSPGHYSSHECALVQRVADTIGPALERCRAEQLVVAFSSLGQRLSGVQTPEEAARVIVAVAADVFGWDAALLSLYSQRENRVRVVLCMDTINGQCRDVTPHRVESEPPAITERTIRFGAQLILREKGDDSISPAPFGNIQKRSASIMMVPIRGAAGIIGVVSVQSYLHHAYTPEDLNVLQSLADHCSGALERVNAELTRRRLVTAVEAAAEAIVVTDTKWRILYVNPAFERVTGYTSDEAVGKLPRELLDSGRYDEAFYEEINDTLGAGLTWSGRIVNRRKDGGTYEEEVRIAPIPGADGKPVSYVSVKRDITGEATLEAQLLQVRKIEAIGQLAGGVAHDFNNLLVAIMGYAELMLGSIPMDSPMRQDLEEIVAAADRGAALTRQLLAFSRRQVLQPEILNLNQVVLNMEKMLRRLIGEHIDLVTEPAVDLWDVNADPGQMEQVIVNLAVNARDAMPGGGRLIIETQNAELDEQYSRQHAGCGPGRYVMLAVSDTGCGMDEETRVRAFEPFYTTKDMGKGTGLGLATVYGIVKQSGGCIWVYSEVGKGTTVKVYLPSMEPRAGEGLEARSAAAVPTGWETILLVEDETAVREMATRVLEGYGYTVLAARTGSEALEVARDHSGVIHLLLTDIVMPGMSGTELAGDLQRLRPELKVLSMSGYTPESVVGSGMVPATMAFVQKPFKRETLAHKVREVLDER